VTTPGKEFHSPDGVDKSEAFRAFVHAPFKEDAKAERNHTSFALQITLTEGEQTFKAMLLGDRRTRASRSCSTAATRTISSSIRSSRRTTARSP
jgi:hypothetical protein